MGNLEERDWRRLIEAIKQGSCVLLTGADVAFESNTPDHVSLLRLLARKLTEGLPSDAPAVGDDLAHVAQLRYPAVGRGDLELEVEEFYRPYANQYSAFHRDLALIPFTLCLSTTPDDFMANAFRDEAHKTPIVAYYHFRKPRKAELTGVSSTRPIVYNLFGALEALDSLVLTETDLLEFLINVVRGAPELPPYIAAQLREKQTSFLFLGFGFQEWYTRILLHVLETYGHRSRSLAVEAATFFDHPDSKRTALFFGNEHKIEFRQHSWFEFAAELRGRYEDEVRRVTPPALPANAPKVFLCYDSRDGDRVMETEECLQFLGIDTWRDQQDLRGGDEWERRIEHVIKKQVDYVLVLQTPNMLERPETFIHTEITEARKRQKRFDQGERFIIPAILEPCEGLERLSDLQRVELTTREDVDHLAQLIQTDWDRRQSRLRGDSK